LLNVRSKREREREREREKERYLDEIERTIEIKLAQADEHYEHNGKQINALDGGRERETERMREKKRGRERERERETKCKCDFIIPTVLQHLLFVTVIRRNT
jgi:hypothetical protein